MDLRMTWLGAAGWLLRWGAEVIVIDPFFHRPPSARPTLPIGRSELPVIDYLLATHAHYDHFADIPYLAATRARQTWVPKAALRDLRRAHRRLPAEQRKFGPDRWRAIEDGARILLDGLTISYHAIGTERFDYWMVQASLRKLMRAGDLQDWFAAGLFLSSHLFGACYALLFELHDAGRKVVFFGNLTADSGRLAERHPDLDVAVLPYCPANGDWKSDSCALAQALRPEVVLVHHFDQFLPPVTVGLDMPDYRRAVEAAAECRVFLPKFFTEITLETVAARS